MKQRYEIRDNESPRARGQRFSSEERARREFAHAVGVVGRWSLVDRLTGEGLDTNT